jgi:hypothetical protein
MKCLVSDEIGRREPSLPSFLTLQLFLRKKTHRSSVRNALFSHHLDGPDSQVTGPAKTLSVLAQGASAATNPTDN